MEYHFEPATFSRDVERLISDMIFPPSNHELKEDIQRLFIYHTLSAIAKRYEKSGDAIKEAFAHRLSEPMPATELVTTSGVTLTVKVNNPRETFDKDAFIKAVSEEFDLSPQRLHKIAEKTVKKSNPPISFSTSYKGTSSHD